MGLSPCCKESLRAQNFIVLAKTAQPERLGQQYFVHQIYFFGTCSLVTVSRMIAVLGPWAGKNMGFIVTGFKEVFYLRKFLTILELKFSQHKMEPCFSGLRSREGEYRADATDAG